MPAASTVIPTPALTAVSQSHCRAAPGYPRPESNKPILAALSGLMSSPGSASRPAQAGAPARQVGLAGLAAVLVAAGLEARQGRKRKDGWLTW